MGGEGGRQETPSVERRDARARKLACPANGCALPRFDVLGMRSRSLRAGCSGSTAIRHAQDHKLITALERFTRPSACGIIIPHDDKAHPTTPRSAAATWCVPPRSRNQVGTRSTAHEHPAMAGLVQDSPLGETATGGFPTRQVDLPTLRRTLSRQRPGAERASRQSQDPAPR